jgi:heavy metal sensor kinase
MPTEGAMRSIRLSLIVYFLLLLTAALGAVCWLAYRTSAAALDERRQASHRLVETQYKTRCDDIRAGLDKRLWRQAQAVASLVRPPVHVEALYPLGLLGMPLTSAGHLHVGLWALEGFAPSRTPKARDKAPTLAEKLFWQRATEIDIEAAEALIPPGQAQEYFQVFLGDGHPSGRSHSLGQDNLHLDPKRIEGDFPQEPVMVQLRPGVAVRCVTLKTRMVVRPQKGDQQVHFPPWLWTWRPPAKAAAIVKSVGPPPMSNAPSPGPEFTQEILIQYAIDMAPTEARLQQSAEERDQQLAQIETETETQLFALRIRFLWIALLSFAGTLAGGYGLLRLGLAPMARLSEAVSEVTERDFRLKVDPARLPAELQPIAQRLSHTLEQLGKAFDREKQAAADISHDLRTPLAALMTTIEVALRKSRSVQEYREVLEECRCSGQQMSSLVERLLALARLDAGADRSRPRPVDAGELALQCADLIRPLASAQDVSLTVHVTPPLPVETDPDKLREVMTNLLHNAVEYNRPGGSIDLSMERTNGELHVEVRDTGIGISPEARQRIFERFYRADPSRHAETPHAGLGLAIVKGYVDLLGGTITVESIPEEGTTFRVRLPVPGPTVEQKLVMA